MASQLADHFEPVRAMTEKPAGSRWFESGERLEIKLNDEAHAAVVDRKVVELFSRVAREIPADSGDAPVWDLSGLLLEGQPVSRSTLITWLNVAYKLSYAEEYESSTNVKPTTATAAELVQLLTFADAVGSTKGLVQAVVSYIEGLDDIHIVVSVAGTDKVLLLDSTSYQLQQTAAAILVQRHGSRTVFKIPHESLTSFVEAVAGQIEQMLYITSKLQLRPLHSKVQGFVTANEANYTFEFTLFSDDDGDGDVLFSIDVLSNTVYSPRVLELLQYTPEAAKGAWIRRLLEGKSV